MKLQAHGIHTDLPLGWEGRIALRRPSATLADPQPSGIPDSSVASGPGAFGASLGASAGPSDPTEATDEPPIVEAPMSEPLVLEAPTAEPATADVEQHFPVAHLANFPLPEQRGDFGSGAVDIMTADDVLLVLAEFGPECANTALFTPREMPTRLTPNMFSGSALQRSHQGQAGCQIFFTHANRAFCLYTVLGRHTSASRVLPQANATLAATRITPR